MSSPCTLIIGLDGATFDLIGPLIRAGYLPTFDRLMAEGTHGSLQAWPNLNSASAWSSIVTGYNPGQHGIYDFGDAPSQLDTAWHPTTAADRKKDPFWRLLSAAGHRVGIINVPITYPADPINGFMLAGMDTPGVRSPGFAHPPGLRDELRQRSIDCILDVPNLGVLFKSNPHQLPRPVEEMVDARSRTILYLMQTRPLDVLMAVFVAPDRVQHHFWPHDMSSVENRQWTPISLLYQQIDRFLREALAHTDENTTVLVVSDHGFGPINCAKRSLNALFAQLGLLRYRQGRDRLSGSLLRNLLLYGRRIVPQPLQGPLAKAFGGLRLRAVSEHMYSGIDWAQTQVFAGPWGGRVFVNLQGRQPEGTVAPEDYQALRERIKEILLNVTDPATGRRVIRAVHQREEIYHGPHVDHAADLLCQWDYEALSNALCYSGEMKPVIIEESERGALDESWVASHRSEGIFVAHGPHIRRGETLANASLYDIAPTILYLQNHPIPTDMNGKVLTGIFTEDYLSHHPVQHGEPPTREPPEAEAALDEGEERKIEERLRGLGYIE